MADEDDSEWTKSRGAAQRDPKGDPKGDSKGDLGPARGWTRAVPTRTRRQLAEEVAEFRRNLARKDRG